MLDGREMAFVKLGGVGGQTTAGKFVENLLLDNPTFNPFATMTTAIVEIAINVGL